MTINKPQDFNEFINRAKNFHVSHTIFEEFLSDNVTFFKELYEITNTFLSDIEDVDDLCRHEMLDEALQNVHNLVISCKSAFSIFDDNSFLKLCPDYLDEYQDEIAEYLDSNDSDMDVRKSINLKFYCDVYDACFFTSICNFLLSSTRCKSMTLREFVYAHSPSKYSDSIPLKRDFSNIRDVDKRLAKMELYDELNPELEKEVDAFKKWKSRHLSNYDNYFARTEWSAIPYVLEHEMSTVYYLAGLPENLAAEYKNITNLYNLLHRERNEPNDAENQSKLGKASTKLKNE